MTNQHLQRDEQRRQLYALLGDLPLRSRLATATTLDIQETEHYLQETLLLDLNGLEPVPAYFLRPKAATGPTPVILYNHSHGGDYARGKDELLIGREYLAQPAYGSALTERGYSVLCIDAWAFGERRGRTESQIFKQMLWSGQVMWGMMVYDSLKAVDYLLTRPDIDPTRIGTLGMSMGSTMAWWVAALDERINVCVDICCLTDYETFVSLNDLDDHGVYYYVPSLLKHFSTADINALIAPRAHLSLAGMYDSLTPVEGLRRVDEALKAVYAACDAEANWRLSVHTVAHLETTAMRAAALSFLATHL